MNAAVLRTGYSWFGYTEVIQIRLVSASPILAKVLMSHPRACWVHGRRARFSLMAFLQCDSICSVAV